MRAAVERGYMRQSRVDYGLVFQRFEKPCKFLSLRSKAVEACKGMRLVGSGSRSTFRQVQGLQGHLALKKTQPPS